LQCVDEKEIQQNFVVLMVILYMKKEVHGSIYREALPSSLRRWEDVSDRSLYFLENI
jgi:hypothetical protein